MANGTTKHYNLDAIIAVDYRGNSKRAIVSKMEIVQQEGNRPLLLPLLIFRKISAILFLIDVKNNIYEKHYEIH